MSSLHTLSLTGKLLPGRDLQDVANALAQLTGMTPEQAHGKLQGRASVIKRELSAEQLPRYLAALEKAGAEITVEPPLSAIPAAEQDAPPPAPAPTANDIAPAPTLDLAPIAPAIAATPELMIVGANPADTMTCPACHTDQPRRTLCLNCGADMPRLLAAQEQAARDELSPYLPPNARVVDSVASTTDTPAALSFSMQGRIGRLRYLAYTLPAILPALALGFLGGFAGAAMGSPGIMIAGVAIGVIATWIMVLRVTVLRLHDLDLSGKWCLLYLLPFPLFFTGSPMAGLIALGVVYLGGGLVLTFKGGAAEVNSYGAPPGPNTLWTVLGALVVVAFSVIAQIKGGDQQKLTDLVAKIQGQGNTEAAQPAEE